jgi:hypothetical protein
METNALWLRVAISVGALTLFVVQLAWPRLRLEATSLGLLALAVLPWLSSVLESAKLPGGWELKFREVEREQRRQRDEIETLRFLIEGYVTDHELTHLRKLASGDPFPFDRSDAFRKELERLVGMGLVGRREGRGVRTVFDAGDDVQKHLAITERGRAYLRHRDTAADF